MFGSQTSNLESQQEHPFTSSLTAPILAPFWAQANFQSQGTVRYAVSRDSNLLQRASRDINRAYNRLRIPLEAVNPTELVIVTWTDLRSVADSNTVRACAEMISNAQLSFLHKLCV